MLLKRCQKLWTPLHYAARYGYLDVVQLLVDSGADPTAASQQEKIALCCAAKAGHYSVLSYLLNKEHDSLQLMEDKAVGAKITFKFLLWLIVLIETFVVHHPFLNAVFA